MENTVTITREEYEAGKATVQLLKDALNLSKGQIAHLNDEIEKLKRMLWGRSSERVVDLPEQQPMLDAFKEMLELLDGPVDKPTETTTVPEHQRVKGKKRKTGEFTLDIPADLPREERVIDVPEEERTMADGTQLVKIGEDRDEKLAFRTGSYFVQVTIRPKYACAGMPELGVVQELAPNGVMKGSKVDESLVAHFTAEKYGMHVPLFRQLERLKAEAGVHMSRQHACSLLMQAGTACKPIFDEALKAILACRTIHVDETGVKMLDPGAGQCQNCKVWVYAAGGSSPPPYAIFDFTTGREQQFLFDALENYSGTVQADAYIAYENLEARFPGIRWAACWAHARRKFEECLKGPSASLAEWVVAKIQCLFLCERVVWEHPPDERLRIRKEQQKPIVDELFSTLQKKLLEDPLILPKSKIAMAIAYLLKRPEAFKRYLADPEVHMDNNFAERQMRKVAIGRKNWLFVGSHKAGTNMAILLSLTQICRNVGVSPTEWFTHVLRVLPDWPKDRMAELLPDRWLAAKTQKLLAV